MKNNGDNNGKEAVELYRCYPNRGYGYFWILVLLFLIGMPLKFAISLGDIFELIWGLLLCSPLIVLSVEQMLWHLFGEESATIEGDLLIIRRTNRLFRRYWSCSLCEIESVDYYERSGWQKFLKSAWGIFMSSHNTLYIELSTSQRKYPIAPELGEEDWLYPDKVIARLRKAVAAAKERAGIKAEKEYWEAVEGFSGDDEETGNV